VWKQQLIWIWEIFVRLLKVCRTFAIWLRQEFCLSSAIKTTTTTTTTFEEKAECNNNLFQVVSRSSFVLILDFEEQSCFDYDFQLRVVVAQIKTTTNICRTFASLSEFVLDLTFSPSLHRDFGNSSDFCKFVRIWSRVLFWLGHLAAWIKTTTRRVWFDFDY
jgi:hypothetical protein